MRMTGWNLVAAGVAVAAIAFARGAEFPAWAVGDEEYSSGISCPTGEETLGVARAAGSGPTPKSRGVKPEVPPVDAQRPARTETATFALG